MPIEWLNFPCHCWPPIQVSCVSWWRKQSMAWLHCLLPSYCLFHTFRSWRGRMCISGVARPPLAKHNNSSVHKFIIRVVWHPSIFRYKFFMWALDELPGADFLWSWMGVTTTSRNQFYSFIIISTGLTWNICSYPFPGWISGTKTTVERNPCQLQGPCFKKHMSSWS